MSRKINYEALRAAIIEKVKDGFEFPDYSPYKWAAFDGNNNVVDFYWRSQASTFLSLRVSYENPLYQAAKLLDINVEDYLEVTHTYKSRVLQWLEPIGPVDNEDNRYYQLPFSARLYVADIDTYTESDYKRFYYLIGLDEQEGYEV